MSLKALWDYGTVELSRAGITDARWQAELLLRFVTGLSRACLLTHPDREADRLATERYRAALRKRALGLPLQYIVGQTEFFGREFRVTPAVLIPRPDTETLVEEALRLLRTESTSCQVPSAKCAPSALLDLCTGSGCVGLTLAAEMPELTVWLADVCEGALTVAADNAAKFGVSARVQFRQGDLFRAVIGMRFCIITANPPYIPSGEIHTLADEVQREPRLALDGGEDGLAYYRRLVSEAPNFLYPGGWLLVEVGNTQAAAVETLLRAANFTEAFVRQDLAGRDRVVGGRLPLDMTSL
ncbi:MAG: Release factor glutamine methyltransferase [Firmicutes bacterium]|nr:Release factor glutamine methyltransferase [Bacillota bacterium]